MARSTTQSGAKGTMSAHDLAIAANVAVRGAEGTTEEAIVAAALAVHAATEGGNTTRQIEAASPKGSTARISIATISRYGAIARAIQAGLVKDKSESEAPLTANRARTLVRVVGTTAFDKALKGLEADGDLLAAKKAIEDGYKAKAPKATEGGKDVSSGNTKSPKGSGKDGRVVAKDGRKAIIREMLRLAKVLDGISDDLTVVEAGMLADLAGVLEAHFTAADEVIAA